ncbi:MAG: CheR family methyltransferase [Clostridia bacterium]
MESTQEIIQVLAESYGADISIYDEAFLQKTMQNRCSLLGIPLASDYLTYLLLNPAEAKQLLESLCINYSEFFRSPLTFTYLEQILLPKIALERTPKEELRIWSAGCAAGQEPYSLAMLLEEIKLQNATHLPYRIIATDMSENELVIAKKGEYPENALQNIRLKQLRAFFQENSGKYTINKDIKAKVSFTSYNLLDTSSAVPQESIFGDFDVVFCSNLLFYYRPDQQQAILQKIVKATRQGGYIVTGESESYLLTKYIGLRRVNSLVPIFHKQQYGGAR